MPIMDNIATNLKAWISARPGLTMKQVAKASGVGFSTIQRICAGEGNPTITNLVAISEAFGRSIHDLLATPLGQPSEPAPATTMMASEACAELLSIVSTMSAREQYKLVRVAEALKGPTETGNAAPPSDVKRTAYTIPPDPADSAEIQDHKRTPTTEKVKQHK